MLSAEVHFWLVIAMFGLAAATFITLWRVTAPYGRHVRPGWGPTLPNRIGWILMESPAVIAFVFFYCHGKHALEPIPLIFLALWLFHYLYRTLVFPFRIRTWGKRMPVLIVASAFGFNIFNALVNVSWISQLGHYETTWLADPRFLVGAVLFFFGLAINFRADTVLIQQRGHEETVYRIPRGRLYRKISCPNYLGEIIEWLGWALAIWSLAGLAFAVYTAANLAPRAWKHHRWYQETFPDYPKDRKALIPYIF